MTKEIGLDTLMYEYGNNYNSEGSTCNYLMFILGGPSHLYHSPFNQIQEHT